jgi:hypothetical protein
MSQSSKSVIMLVLAAWLTHAVTVKTVSKVKKTTALVVWLELTTADLSTLTAQDTTQIQTNAK